MLSPVRTVAPAVRPVSLAEAKRHCRVDASYEDAYIEARIDAAVSHVDGYSGYLSRALITQTWQQDFGCFRDGMRLRVGNVLAVSSVTYYDGDNASQTLATTVYTARTDARGGYLDRKPDQDWPSVYDRPDAVRVTWTAGYGPAASDVPMAIRQAILLMVGHLFVNREAVSDRPMIETPMAVAALLSPFRRFA